MLLIVKCSILSMVYLGFEGFLFNDINCQIKHIIYGTSWLSGIFL